MRKRIAVMAIGPHAMTSLSSGESYTYDNNGNMTCRTEDGITYKQVYNAENRISSIQKISQGTCDSITKLSLQWDFVHDGDGVRTATLTTPYDEDGLPLTLAVTSYYFGGAYEVTGSDIKKYAHWAGSQHLCLW